jgi:hypothetical protein
MRAHRTCGGTAWIGFNYCYLAHREAVALTHMQLPRRNRFLTMRRAQGHPVVYCTFSVQFIHLYFNIYVHDLRGILQGRALGIFM